MDEERTLTEAERKVVDAFLALLTPAEFALIAAAFPQTTGRAKSRLRNAVLAEEQRRSRRIGL